MDNLLAALTFFTRLPFWRIRQVPQECYSHVVSYWSITGWLTGGIMALVCWISVHFVPVQVAVMLALASRLLVTGALHEDGLADFFDGFGGGNGRDSVLSIMKDSHIGTYGTLGLVVYYLMAYAILTSIGTPILPYVLLCGDAVSKCVCSHIVHLLPYARKDTESKNGTVYQKPGSRLELTSLAGGVAALILLAFAPYLSMMPFVHNPGNLGIGLFSFRMLSSVLFPAAVFAFLQWLFRRVIGGYTGDCCGAAFLLCELSFWLGTLILL